MAVRREALPFLALAFLALVLGTWAGLVRIGWPWPALTDRLVADHGPLLVSGFVGTLIALERAAAIGRRWGYASPLLTAVGALVLLADVPWDVGAALIALGSAVLAALFFVILMRQPMPATSLMLTGALAWVAGNVLWAVQGSIPAVVGWWAAFLVLVIAGERLELSRIRPTSTAALAAFLIAADTAVFGAALSSGLGLTGDGASILGWDPGVMVEGIGFLAMALWLAARDIARYQLRTPGLSRFIASALLAGFGWLAVGGIALAAFAVSPTGFGYDAMLHSVFLGFVISMIFAHAPIIFPAVLGLPLPFRRAFYGHLVLLHVGLVMRVAGDITGSADLRAWGGLVNGVALMGFLVVTAVSVRLGAPQSAPSLGEHQIR